MTKVTILIDGGYFLKHRPSSQCHSLAILTEDIRVTARIHIPQDELADFCRRNHIRKLALFGSVLRDDFTPDSDVDVLVEFEPGKVPGLSFFTLDEEMSPIFGGRKVDLRTFDGVEQLRNYIIREAILGSVEVLYDGTQQPSVLR